MSPQSQTVVVAINGKKNSKNVIKWALDNFLPKESLIFKLLHVCVRITSVPTPFGIIPVEQVREDIADAYEQEVERKTNEMLVLYERMFLERKVQVDVLRIEGDDIANTIANEVSKGRVNKLVIGGAASSRFSVFSRKVNGSKYSAKIVESIPSFCTVYAVSKGKLSSVRQSFSETDGSVRDDKSDRNSSSLQTASAASGNLSKLDLLVTPTHPELAMQRHEDLLNLSRTLSKGRSDSIDLSPSGNKSVDSRDADAYFPPPPSYSETFSISSHASAEPGTPKEMYCIDEKSEELVKPETEKFEDEKREASLRKEPQNKSAHDARESEKPQETTFGPMQQYKKFTWEEIVTGTSSFSEKFIIGQGAYGTVYKCNLFSTTAAVKVLHSTELQSAKQFQHELEILSRIRHPYLLLLLGACPEKVCLVYEYMENGSLEDRLFRRNNKTAPIPWFDRFRIAWEIASGLVFLHNSKPEQIIHRDLKPANILLDHNLGSKIGDVGLSKMVYSVEASAMSMLKQTAIVGTLSYIDPEYQRTGVNSPKSDVYAFGLILLQLLTAKTTTALPHLVETAVDDGNLVMLLDRKAGQWPLEEAKELAILGLSCAEIRRRDRPDLKTHVLPTLERLRAAADRAREAAHNNLSAPPSHFLCPIIKEVMNDPCVASDGYTYDRKSIETWLGANDKSPMTNVTLPSKDLIPNFTLLFAISQWKSEQA